MADSSSQELIRYNYHADGHPNEYWALPRYSLWSPRMLRAHLEERKYAVSKSIKANELAIAARRSELRQISFANLTNDDLRKFIRERAIHTDFGKAKIGRRRQLIAAIENDDANPKFYRFTSLPPELRNRIYEYHFADIAPRSPHTRHYMRIFKQPPLTIACRLIRKETLSLFYSSTLFECGLVWNDMVRGLTLPIKTQEWLHNMTVENMAHVQRIYVHIARPLVNGMKYIIAFVMVNLTKGENDWLEVQGLSLSTEGRARLRDSFNEVFRNVIATSGTRHKLIHQDFRDLQAAVEQINLT